MRGRRLAVSAYPVRGMAVGDVSHIMGFVDVADRAGAFLREWLIHIDVLDFARPVA